MLTTEDFGLGDYTFKSSPESCSDHSYSTDYMDFTSDEDFLTQLSSDLDIPLLLNLGEDEMSMLNSFLDKSPEEILSDAASPPYQKEDNLSKEITELQQMDFSQCGPEAFPNLQAEIKTEFSDGASSTDSIKSPSPVHIGIKDEIYIKSSPSSPNSIVINTINSAPSSPSSISSHITNNLVYSPPVQLVTQSKVSKLVQKHVPIIPKTSYSLPASSNKVVVIKNSDFKISTPAVTSPNVVTKPNVVVLENVGSVPIKNVTTFPQMPVVSHPSVTNINNVTQSVTVPSVVIGSTNSFPIGPNSNIDPKILKRQQRKIKNRESACLSRKKKKDYVISLEEKVKELTKANERLLAENSQLKEKLAQYENNSLSKNKSVNKNIKQSLILCIFLLVVGINLDFIRNPFTMKNQLDLIQKRLPEVNDHHGRSLLWTAEDTEEKNKTSNFSPFLMCPAMINQTESARLVLELERWIGKPDDISAKFNLNNTPNKEIVPKLKPRRRRYKLNSPLVSAPYRRDRVKTEQEVNVEKKNEIQVFSMTPEHVYSEFFEAINRKDDTFYVVSFTDQHMLLPALHHNKTRRPKMSLIMPSMLPNDTVSQTSLLPLMQIDCEVLDTRLIHIKRGAIPQHLRTYGNVTKKNPSSDTNVGNSSGSETKYYEKTYKPYFINKHSLKPNSKFYNLS